MTRELYIPQDNQWISHDEFDREKFHQDVYNQLGVANLNHALKTKSNGEVLLRLDKIPTGVKENDVKQAVKDNHPHR